MVIKLLKLVNIVNLNLKYKVKTMKKRNRKFLLNILQISRPVKIKGVLWRGTNSLRTQDKLRYIELSR